MAWYWWIIIIFAILYIIAACYEAHERHQAERDAEDDWERAMYLIIIADLKYKRPELWAKLASDVMGRRIDPPTPEQCEVYFKKHPEQKP